MFFGCTYLVIKSFLIMFLPCFCLYNRQHTGLVCLTAVIFLYKTSFTEATNRLRLVCLSSRYIRETNVDPWKLFRAKIQGNNQISATASADVNCARWSTE